jgi:N-acetylglutamate synthase-like GNAT family acetyltransferase
MAATGLSSVSVRPAGPPDAQGIVAVLDACALKSDDILVEGTAYFVAVAEAIVVGVVGLEGFGTTACLLRSLAVIPDFRGSGIGRRLMATAEAAAAGAGAKRLYLFSTNAGPYYVSIGYVEVPVPELVAMLPQAPQVKQYDRLGWLPSEVAWRRELGP